MKTALFSMVLSISTSVFSQEFEKVIDQNLFMLQLSENSLKESKAELLERFPEGEILIDEKQVFQFQTPAEEIYWIFKTDDYENYMVNFFHSDVEKYDGMLANFSVSDDFVLFEYPDQPGYIQANSTWSQFGIQFFEEDSTYTFSAVLLKKREESKSQMTD